MDKKVDLRVIKTKRNIKAAMISLLNEKDFHDITVQDVLDRAIINRSTFYRYYKDKYDLAEQLCGACLNSARAILNERFQAGSRDEMVCITRKMYDYILEEKDTIEALMKIKTENISLYQDFEKLLRSGCLEFLNSLHPKMPPEFADYSSALYASAVLATVGWLAENSPASYLSANDMEEKTTKILFRLSHVLDGIFDAK